MNTLDECLVDLEIRFTHQEAMLQQLNDVIISQQKLIDGLALEIEILKQQITAQAQFNIANTSEETPPPHY